MPLSVYIYLSLSGDSPRIGLHMELVLSQDILIKPFFVERGDAGRIKCNREDENIPWGRYLCARRKEVGTKNQKGVGGGRRS